MAANTTKVSRKFFNGLAKKGKICTILRGKIRKTKKLAMKKRSNFNILSIKIQNITQGIVCKFIKVLDSGYSSRQIFIRLEYWRKTMSEQVLKMTREKYKKSSTSKRQKFVELAERRTVNAIKAVRVIGKLGNRSAYEYDDEDVRKIVKVLTDEIEALKLRMKSTKRSDGVDFKL
ncbi:MAG: hypothetical protein Q7V31_09000 [Parvibaculum sp.]|uniref:hypothetical protein n=1 Tax=Parvibaculum sp. TaxID=2024848 RepID=UPI00271A14F4|nr:hypothetical protein [Parvibaculum sp.]MDO8839056.1 hypothetical protein [Parvibaculum sp.]